MGSMLPAARIGTAQPRTPSDGVIAELGPLAWYKLDEPEGTVPLDSSGNGNDAINFHGGEMGHSGVDGTSALFYGNDSGILIPRGMFEGLTQLSITGWVYWDQDDPGAAEQDTVFSLTSLTGDRYLRFQLYQGGNGFTLRGYNGSGSEARVNWDRWVPLGGWVHIAVALDGVEAALYVNGRRVTKQPFTMTPQSFDDLAGAVSPLIGGSNQTPFFFKGRIDDMAFFDRALTDEEILGLAVSYVKASDYTLGIYRATVLGNKPELYLRFNEDAGPVLADSSGLLYHGTAQPGVILGVDQGSTVDGGTGARLASPTAEVTIPLWRTIYRPDGLAVEFWAKLDSDLPSSGTWSIFSLGDQNGGLGINSDGSLNAGVAIYLPPGIDNKRNIGIATVPGTLIADDMWHHFVWIYHAGQFKLMKDGLVLTTTTTQNNQGVQSGGDTTPGIGTGGVWGSIPITFGDASVIAGSLDPANAFPGLIDEIAIYPIYNDDDNMTADHYFGSDSVDDIVTVFQNHFYVGAGVDG